MQIVLRLRLPTLTQRSGQWRKGGATKRVSGDFFAKKVVARLSEVRDDAGTPRGIRTPDPLLRRQLLYPTELLAHIRDHLENDYIILLLLGKKVNHQK